MREELVKRDLKEDSFTELEGNDKVLVFRGPDGVMYAVNEKEEIFME